jgi:hypothetical protein
MRLHVKVRIVPINDNDANARIDELNRALTEHNEKIVFMTSNDRYLFLAVGSNNTRSPVTNLLLEEIKARGTKNDNDG